MATDPRAVRRFVATYLRNLSSYKTAADLARRLIEEHLRGENLELHGVFAREKEVASLSDKLRRKGYKNPFKQLTDLVGVRVIVYYEEAVDEVAVVLKREFEEHRRFSVDKRADLKANEFGYRSLHLILRLKEPRASASEYRELAGKWFEVQIRTVLEHAWAEIEHEIAYKSGVRLPDELRRQFSAIAGNLEVLDREFSRLKGETAKLMPGHLERFQSGEGMDEELDTARLHACLQLL